jgi:hypothetical protein
MAPERLAQQLTMRPRNALCPLVAHPLEQTGRVHQVGEQERDGRPGHRPPSYNHARSLGKRPQPRRRRPHHVRTGRASVAFRPSRATARVRSSTAITSRPTPTSTRPLPPDFRDGPRGDRTCDPLIKSPWKLLTATETCQRLPRIQENGRCVLGRCRQESAALHGQNADSPRLPSVRRTPSTRARRGGKLLRRSAAE